MSHATEHNSTTLGYGADAVAVAFEGVFSADWSSRVYAQQRRGGLRHLRRGHGDVEGRPAPGLRRSEPVPRVRQVPASGRLT